MSESFQFDENGNGAVRMKEQFVVDCDFGCLAQNHAIIVILLMIYFLQELIDDKSKVAIACVQIDYYTLALCPQSCEFEVKHLGTGKQLGAMCFELEFQQLEEI